VIFHGQGTHQIPDIMVTKHHLAVEYFAPESTPTLSKASGITADEYSSQGAAAEAEAAPMPRVAWLLEPKCSATVQKWSGSNQYPTWNNNKLGNTLNAFSHYVYFASHGQLVIADLQSLSFSPSLSSIFHALLAANARGDDGNTVHTLFDVIFHSPDQFVLQLSSP
jgi:hypothetical protein